MVHKFARLKASFARTITNTWIVQSAKISLSWKQTDFLCLSGRWAGREGGWRLSEDYAVWTRMVGWMVWPWPWLPLHVSMASATSHQPITVCTKGTQLVLFQVNIYNETWSKHWMCVACTCCVRPTPASVSPFRTAPASHTSHGQRLAFLMVGGSTKQTKEGCHDQQALSSCFYLWHQSWNNKVLTHLWSLRYTRELKHIVILLWTQWQYALVCGAWTLDSAKLHWCTSSQWTHQAGGFSTIQFR